VPGLAGGFIEEKQFELEAAFVTRRLAASTCSEYMYLISVFADRDELCAKCCCCLANASTSFGDGGLSQHPRLPIQIEPANERVGAVGSVVVMGAFIIALVGA
jgi:hypothetical protein